MSKYCTNCGKEIDPSVKYCTNCGAKNLIHSEASIESSSNANTNKDYPFFTIHGRLNRLRYLKYSLTLLIAFLFLLIMIVLIFTLGNEYLTGLVSFITIIVYIICQTFLTIRRFHDLNYSSFYCLWLYIAILCFYYRYCNDFYFEHLLDLIFFSIYALSSILVLLCLIFLGSVGKLISASF